MGKLVSRTEAMRTRVSLNVIDTIWGVHDCSYDVVDPQGLAIREFLKQARKDICDHSHTYFVESKNVAMAVFAAFGATEIYDSGTRVYAFDSNGKQVGEAYPRRLLTEFQN